jgi:glycosyltransferase involved in cell wall biosynthesis
MRVLHVVPSYIPAYRYGGPIHSVHGLCKALAARGHRVDVATTNVDGDSVSDVPVATPVDLDGVQVHYFPSTALRRLYHSPRMDRFMAEGVARWDLVHTHSVFLWPTTAAARIARGAGKPYVVSPRGMLVRDLIQRRSSLLKKSWIGLFERANIDKAAAVHVTSKVEGDEMLALGLKPRRIFEIPNGYDLPAAKGAVAPDPGLPDRYVLFLGRISWKKGIDRLLRAMALVPGLPLVVAGNDDENYWPSMAALASEPGLAGRVHSIGYVEGARKEALLRGATMLALASYSENFGNVVLEAMALGVPVVVTPEVGLAPQVAARGAGLVADGEPARFAEAIARLAGDEALRARCAQAALAAAREYSWDSVAARMEDEYRALLDG